MNATTRVGERILVVDDDLPTCILSKDFLQRGGYSVTTATRPEEAVTTVKRGEHFDLAVLDVVMPTMTGDECARQIRVYLPDVRILFLTGYSGALFQAKPMLWDGEAFLEKPCSENGLLEAVSLLLHGTIGNALGRKDRSRIIGTVDSGEPPV